MTLKFKVSDYKKLIFKEFSFQILEKLLRIVCGFIIISKLSNFLGPEEYGALLFIESFILVEKDLIIVPLMCILCVAIPFVLVTIAPRFIPAAEVNLFFLLETIIGPIWVWFIIKEQPSVETLIG